MNTIDEIQYSAITAGATVLEQSVKYGPSVWLTDDNQIIKAFHRKRRHLAERFSYARRFERHCRRLAKRGFRTAQVKTAYRCPQVGSEIVIYDRLDGVAVRRVAAGSPQAERVLGEFADFLALLHRRGVHFRGIHLGNILYDETLGFALIDVGFMRFYPWPVGLHERAANFQNILRYAEDARLIETFGFERFIQRYLQAAALRPRRALRLDRLLRTRLSTLNTSFFNRSLP